MSQADATAAIFAAATGIGRQNAVNGVQRAAKATRVETAAPTSEQQEAVVLTKQESMLIGILQSFTTQMEAAPTDDARAVVFSRIEARLNQTGVQRTVKNYAGLVLSTDVDQDRALIKIVMSDGFIARTAKLEMFDEDRTAIKAGSNLYRTVARLRPGERVRFDGFVAKLKMDGKGEELLPMALVVRFTDIRPMP